VIDWQRQPGQGKYAKPERERRFLLTALPSAAGSPRLIEDRYLDGTRLRLRRVETTYKFCQKVRPDEADPSVVAITNIYLSPAEYEVLRALPAATLTKTRRHWQLGPFTFAVDEFHGPLTGLLLAEIELDDLTVDLPVGDSPFGPEVTHDDRFSGGKLATATKIPG
jgi:CYTH domain-containing protein